MSAIGIDELREAVSAALGDGRAADASADRSLVRTGVISSLEIVLVSLALEKRFAVRIPDSAVTIGNFDTLAAMARLVSKLSGDGLVPPAAPPTVDSRNPIMASLARTLRRPLALVMMTATCLVALDLSLLAVMRGPLASRYHAFLEFGHRLYPVSGGYSGDDLRFAVSQHGVVGEPRTPGPRVGFFGDSGTIGSWVDFTEAIPAQTEVVLRNTHPSAEVFNLAFFMQFFAKDLMILEAVLQQTPATSGFGVVVFTLGDDYFARSFIRALPREMPFLALNRDLLAEFSTRVPDESRAPLQDMLGELAAASHGSMTGFVELLTKRSAIYHYAPFFRYFVDELPLVESLNPNYNFPMQYAVGRTPLYSPVPAQPPPSVPLNLGVPEGDFDRRVPTLLQTAIAFLHQRGTRVVLFLKPHGPNEWKALYRVAGTTALDVANRVCAGSQCSVVDMRWALSGSQFTDSLAHYNAKANRMLGEAVAAAIDRELASASGDPTRTGSIGQRTE